MNTPEKIVAALTPSDGWWCGDTEDTLIECATLMLARGLADDDISNILDSVIVAIRSEYGE